MKYKISSAAFLFFGVLVATLFLQVSQSQSQTNLDQVFPNAELELETVDQVQEINEHNFQNFELPTSSAE